INELSATYGLTIGSGSGVWGARAGSESGALAGVVRGLGGGSSDRIRQALAASQRSGDLQQVAAALQAAQALDRMAAAADLAAGRTSDYAAVLARATEAERQQAARSAGATVLSLADYARSLQVGERSPLSATDQLDAARRQFDAVSSAAQRGDATSLQRFQGFADQYLQAARLVDGSGTGYASAVERVTSALGGVTGLSTEQLTAGFYAQQVAGTNAVLTDGFAQLSAEVQALRLVVQTSGFAPARLAG
ncbi:MAG: hypothetical protein IM628_06945, partial [Phenylobacterium sp.]|uniref:hypothetical protein n=1 Tax=Phenylobacterium sp. TaxID=1871053 RepID=UPI0025D620A1